jgi:hypothetical protein
MKPDQDLPAGNVELGDSEGSLFRIVVDEKENRCEVQDCRVVVFF